MLAYLFRSGAAMCDSELSAGKIAVLKLLKQAHDDAEDAGQDLWQFAIRKAVLLGRGATVNDLRWLLSRRLVDQAAELTKCGDGHRRFSKLTGLYLPDDACFILTHGGRVYVERNHLDHALHRAPGRRDGMPAMPPRISAKVSHGRPKPPRTAAARPYSSIETEPQTPDWRPIEGELHFRGDLLRRRGRKVARLEELLLKAFADAGWVHSIANPFRGFEAQRQLIEAVRRLNNSLRVHRVRFHVYERGEIVSWEECIMAPKNSRANSKPPTTRPE